MDIIACGVEEFDRLAIDTGIFDASLLHGHTVATQPAAKSRDLGPAFVQAGYTYIPFCLSFHGYFYPLTIAQNKRLGAFVSRHRGVDARLCDQLCPSPCLCLHLTALH